ncbi:hypothetical protein RHMOL_Rhmol05G0154500 [Rhododendron molle]|uniref:Uncharacterized protein n=1 Tax=Rhododendron molle TaxID=49168 RepID=A0ACC0NPP2_RHOML|nr:hypothetical protein RHMOL_Rhmol05G0154500 [Rhododendron molle]
MFTFATTSSTRSSSPALHPNSRLTNGIPTIRRTGNVAAKTSSTATAATEIGEVEIERRRREGDGRVQRRYLAGGLDGVALALQSYTFSIKIDCKMSKPLVPTGREVVEGHFDGKVRLSLEKYRIIVAKESKYIIPFVGFLGVLYIEKAILGLQASTANSCPVMSFVTVFQKDAMHDWPNQQTDEEREEREREKRGGRRSTLVTPPVDRRLQLSLVFLLSRAEFCGWFLDSFGAAFCAVLWTVLDSHVMSIWAVFGLLFVAVLVLLLWCNVGKNDGTLWCYYWVVFVSRSPGIYTTWETAGLQVNGYPGNLFKRYTTFDEAEGALLQFHEERYRLLQM